MRLFLIVATLFFAGCATLAKLTPIQIPMQATLVPSPLGKANTLIILLPGAMDTPADLAREGFATSVHHLGVAADVLLVDAHIGYYSELQIVERLEADILQPLRKQYATIWLTGISLGGYGSILHSKSGTTKVDGVFIMAAFLGSRDVPAAVEKAGGLAQWQAGEISDKEHDKAIWQWLQTSLYAPDKLSRKLPPLYIGYGTDDRFIQSNALLGRSLPAGHVFAVPGGHTWGPWRQLWDQWLTHVVKPSQ
jgi:hypothetical protein